MDIVMIGEVREKKDNTIHVSSHTILPTIWTDSAKLVLEKSTQEINSYRSFENMDSTQKEKMAENNLWNQLSALRKNALNEKELTFGPLYMQLKKEEKEEVKNIEYKEEAIEKLNHWGGYLGYMSEDFKDNEELVALAMVNDSYNFKHASERIRSNKETVFILLQYNESLSEYIGQSLKEEIGDNNALFYLKSYFLNKQLQEIIPGKLENNTANTKIKI